MVSFGFYVIWQNVGNSSNNFLAPTPVVSSNNIKKSSKPKLATIIPTTILPKPIPVVILPPPKKTGIYNDGEYIGNSADAYYGSIQVKAVISNGQLADVVFLDYPQDRGTSVRINNQAMPILKSEAIQTQNSNVNTVSGATDSSGAFRESLASALSQAKA